MAKTPLTEEQPNTEGTPADKPAPDHITGTAPEELAKTSNVVPGPISGAALTAELDRLPSIPALQGIRANAAGGYYVTAPREELEKALAGLDFGDNAGATESRDKLLERVRAGDFGGSK